MSNEILFSEKQKFKQWWFWLILIGINLVFLLGTYKQVINGVQFGNKAISNTALLITLGILILFVVFFIICKLETQIKKDGIYVRFFPFHLKFKHYSWHSLSNAQVRKYSPLIEYGGWGYRQGLFGKGKAFNVSGNKGLQLVFTNNKKLLIGTNKPEELSQALQKLITKNDT